MGGGDPLIYILRRTIGLTLLIAALGATIWLAASTASFDECQAKGPGDTSTDTYNKASQVAIRVVGLDGAMYVKCAIYSLNENNGFITAIATILLAFITYQLVVGGAETTRVQLRSYPGIIGAEIDLFDDRINIRITVKNYSTTPAYNFRHAITHRFCEPTVAATIPIKVAYRDTQWDMAPRSTTTMRTSGRVAPGQFSSLASGDLQLVVSGRADYVDTFRAKRHIKFRYRSTDFIPVTFERNGIVFLDKFACPEPDAIKYSSN